MKRIKHVRTSVLAAVFAFTSGAVSAQDSSTLAPKTTPTGVAYVSGGVGNAQQQEMKEAMKNYNLRLTFARQQTGAYLSSVKVTIDQLDAGHGGTLVLDTMANGPMLFAELPPGKYGVRAEVEGQVQMRTLEIKQGKAQDLIFHFPAKPS